MQFYDDRKSLNDYIQYILAKEGEEGGDEDEQGGGESKKMEIDNEVNQLFAKVIFAEIEDIAKRIPNATNRASLIRGSRVFRIIDVNPVIFSEGILKICEEHESKK